MKIKQESKRPPMLNRRKRRVWFVRLCNPPPFDVGALDSFFPIARIGTPNFFCTYIFSIR